MNKEEYNGWYNYETWLVNLWMDNEQGSQSFWAEQAQEAYNQAEPGTYDWQTREFVAVTDLAQQLRDLHEDQVEQSGIASCGLLADLIGAALSEVNWTEIAEHLINDVNRDDEAAA